MKAVGIGFLGCGNIGCGVFRLLEQQRAQMEENEGVSFDVRRILVRSAGKQRGADIPAQLLTESQSMLMSLPSLPVQTIEPSLTSLRVVSR